MNAREIFDQAKTNGRAIGAFNAGNIEILKAIVQAARHQKTPVIVEASAREAQHFGSKNLLAVVDNFRFETGLPILTNFDHGPGLEECLQAIDFGYNLVHFDGSALPYEENIKITKLLVEQARPKGVLIEAEIDKIAGESLLHQDSAESLQATSAYTDPDKAADFVNRTECNLLAVFIGNLHGVYPQPPKLDIERLKIISQKVNCYLSLHGGSGLLEEDVKAAINLGVVKVNINTELRIAFRQTLENILRGSDEMAVYKIMVPVVAAVEKVVEGKIAIFNNRGLNDQVSSGFTPLKL